MSLSPGARLGPYEVIAPIGAGGMGEVFKARDTRLERSVAIKILPADFAQNVQLKLRFEREAKTISQLSHPNICTLYDVGDGYLVMELLDGETLADRIAKGPLPLDQVIRIGTEIANALDRAHKAGVVHRDLKPGNVMLTKPGAKLLDFGLARSGGQAASPLLSGATQLKPLTEEGTLIGTFQYMAPEQLEGHEADARTDIFALGAVLYEMVTGRRAFEGKSKASVIASILAVDPQPASATRPASPAALDRLIRTCLAKDPDERWQSAHDVAIELRNVTSSDARSSTRRGAPWWIIPLIAAAAAGALTWAATHVRKEAPRVVTSSILPPENTNFAFIETGPPALSPDGQRLVFVVAAAGHQMLYVRALAGAAAQPLAGTEGATFPFWSPDGKWIAFFAVGRLRKIASAGGVVQTIAEASNGRGGTWSPSGVIVFAQTLARPLSKVADDGGVAVPVRRMERGESNQRFPSFLPDGRHFIYESLRYGGSAIQTGDLVLASVDDEQKKTLVAANSNGIYASGYLLYVRDRSLVAQKLDPKRLTLDAKVTPVVETVARSRFGDAVFSVSPDGTLVYDSAFAFDDSRMQWFDTAGKSLDTVGPPRDIRTPSLSHDGHKVASSILDPATSRTDIWIDDLDRGTSTRLTFNAYDDFVPVWSPDDSMVVYGSSARGAGDIMIKKTSGAGEEELLYSTADFKVPYDWSPDGKTILFQNQAAETGWDLWVYSIVDRRAAPLLVTPAQEFDPKFSPDGRWIAYQSDASSPGKYDIYVLPVASGQGKWQVSTNGGRFPRWSRDGNTIFYLDDTAKLMAVDVTLRVGGFSAGVPRPLFSVEPSILYRTPGTQYDVAADGKRFLFNIGSQHTDSSPLTLVQNWTAALDK